MNLVFWINVIVGGSGILGRIVFYFLKYLRDIKVIKNYKRKIKWLGIKNMNLMLKDSFVCFREVCWFYRNVGKKFNIVELRVLSLKWNLGFIKVKNGK